MIFIFGGLYQGKLDYALTRFALTENDVFHCTEDSDNEPKNKKIIYELDKWILALTKNKMDVNKAIKQFIKNNPDVIIICNDISCGIVPLDPVQRKWREAAGRAAAVLAQNSTEVIRIFCGIPSQIK